MKKNKNLLLIGLLFGAIGLIAWMYQGFSGLASTNMRNPFPWGLYIASFEFYVGAAAGAMLIFSLAYLFSNESLKPMARIAAFTSFACTIAAGVAIVTDLGSPMRLFQVLFSPNFNSPLIWDIGIMTLFLIVSLLVVIPQMRTKVRPSRGLALLGLVMSIVLVLLTSLLFFNQSTNELWSSITFPFDSLAVGFALGGAVVILFSLLFTGKDSLAQNEKAYGFVARIAVVFLVVHLALVVFELFSLLVRNTVESKQQVEILFGQYGWLYALELMAFIIGGTMFAMKKYSKQYRPLLISSLLVILGAFIHKLMILLPSFNAIPLALEVDGAGLWTMPVSVGTSTEGSASFVNFWPYVPSFIEWAVSLLPLGLALVIVAYLVERSQRDAFIKIS